MITKEQKEDMLIGMTVASAIVSALENVSNDVPINKILSYYIECLADGWEVSEQFNKKKAMNAIDEVNEVMGKLHPNWRNSYGDTYDTIKTKKVQ